MSTEVKNTDDANRMLRPRKQISYRESNANDGTTVSSKRRQPANANLNETYVVPPKVKKATTSSSSKNDEKDEHEEPKQKKAKEIKKGGKAKPNAKESNNTGKMDRNEKEPTKKEKGETNKDKSAMNKTDTDYSKLDFNNDKISASGNKWNVKIASWNVDGLRAWVKKGGMKYLEHEDPDILCLQEVKCTKDQVPPECTPEGFHCFWVSSDKDGYAGAGLLSKTEPLKVTYGLGKKEFDDEGRVITAEYDNFYLVNVYVPNAGRGLVTLPKRMSWDVEFRNYLKHLDSKKPVIICGDMNVSHKEIDLANPKTNQKNAGFTKEEREGMTELLAEGFVDTYRHLYPEETGAYTFWTYLRGARSRNVGWRLDYFLVSERMIDQVCDNVIRNEVLGSDHCPIALLFHNK